MPWFPCVNQRLMICEHVDIRALQEETVVVHGEVVDKKLASEGIIAGLCRLQFLEEKSKTAPLVSGVML